MTKVCSGADFKSRKMIATGLVMLRLTYRIQVYGQANDYLIQILQTQQNRAARFVANSALGTRTSAVLKQVGWLSVKQLFVYHSLLLVWKIQQSGEPLFLKEKFMKRFPYATRQATGNCFSLNDTPKSEFSRKSFVYGSSVLWNSLPSDVRKTEKLLPFKTKLKCWVKENVSI